MQHQSPPWRVFDASPIERTPENAQGGVGPLGGLPIQPVVLLGLLGALGLAIGAIVIGAGSMGGERLVDGPGGAAGDFGSAGPDAVPVALVVDVSGAVVNPGLYRLAPGSRVGDAVQAAGGYGPRVNVERVAGELNLAAALTDGARIRVPSRDDPPDSAGGDADQGGSGTGLVDLNKASQSELESLPGIGPVTATKIMAAREEAPFHSIDELRERGLVGEKTFDSIRALITT